MNLKKVETALKSLIAAFKEGEEKPAKGKKGKAAEEDEEDFDLDGDDDDADEEDSDDEDGDEDSDDDADEEDSDDEDGPTIETVTKALQKLANRKPIAKSREKAKGILKKFKVTSVRDIPEKHFQKALDLIEGA